MGVRYGTGLTTLVKRTKTRRKIVSLTKPVNIATYLAAAMLTYYFRNPEDALRRAKADSKHPGCYFGGITLPSGKRGFAVYKDGKIVTQYAVMGGN